MYWWTKIYPPPTPPSGPRPQTPQKSISQLFIPSIHFFRKRKVFWVKLVQKSFFSKILESITIFILHHFDSNLVFFPQNLFLIFFPREYLKLLFQGVLTETVTINTVDLLVLTSSNQLLFILTPHFFKTTDLYEEVNRTEPSLSVGFPGCPYAFRIQWLPVANVIKLFLVASKS